MCAEATRAGVFGFDAGMNFIVGHSWATKLRISGEVAANYEFIDQPGGTFQSLSNKLRNRNEQRWVGYVFVFLGGNDIDNAADTLAVNKVKDECNKFCSLLRLKFPGAKIVYAQVEERLERGSLTPRDEYRRKANKFNKWLNVYGNKDSLLILRGLHKFSQPIWYAYDGVHLNEAGIKKLAGFIHDFVRKERMAQA